MCASQMQYLSSLARAVSDTSLCKHRGLNRSCAMAGRRFSLGMVRRAWPPRCVLMRVWWLPTNPGCRCGMYWPRAWRHMAQLPCLSGYGGADRNNFHAVSRARNSVRQRLSNCIPSVLFSLGFGARYLRPVFATPKAWRILEMVIAIVMWTIAQKHFLDLEAAVCRHAWRPDPTCKIIPTQCTLNQHDVNLTGQAMPNPGRIPVIDQLLDKPLAQATVIDDFAEQKSHAIIVGSAVAGLHGRKWVAG